MVFEMWNMRRQETLWVESAQQLVWTHQEFDPNWTRGEDDVKCIDQMRLGQHVWKLDYCKREKDYFRATERARRISGAHPATENRTKGKGQKTSADGSILKVFPKVCVDFLFMPFPLSSVCLWILIIFSGSLWLSVWPRWGNAKWFAKYGEQPVTTAVLTHY